MGSLLLVSNKNIYMSNAWWLLFVSYFIYRKFNDNRKFQMCIFHNMTLNFEFSSSAKFPQVKKCRCAKKTCLLIHIQLTSFFHLQLYVCLFYHFNNMISTHAELSILNLLYRTLIINWCHVFFNLKTLTTCDWALYKSIFLSLN